MDKGKIAIVLSVLSLIVYPLSDILCVGLILFVLSYAIIVLKNKEVSVKVTQPAIMLTTIYALRGVLAIIIGIISNIAMFNNGYYSSQLYDNIVGFNRVMNLICLFLIFIYALITIIFFAMDKDVPLFGKLSRSINN